MSAAPLGVLILHGYTGYQETVSGLVPHLEAAGLPYRMPALRGHWTRPEDLAGVTAQHWHDDALAAFEDLRREADRVVIVALSMGGLVGLWLAMERPTEIAGMVSVATALRFQDPLAPLCGLMARLFKQWKMPPAPTDCAYGQARNYPSFATDSFVEFYRMAQRIEADLPKVTVPLLILHSHNDRTIKPISAQILYDRVASTDKRLVWFERSGHEMMLDWEKERVFELTMEFIRAHQPVSQA